MAICSSLLAAAPLEDSALKVSDDEVLLSKLKALTVLVWLPSPTEQT